MISSGDLPVSNAPEHSAEELPNFPVSHGGNVCLQDCVQPVSSIPDTHQCGVKGVDLFISVH